MTPADRETPQLIMSDQTNDSSSEELTPPKTEGEVSTPETEQAASPEAEQAEVESPANELSATGDSVTGSSADEDSSDSASTEEGHTQPEEVSESASDAADSDVTVVAEQEAAEQEALASDSSSDDSSSEGSEADAASKASEEPVQPVKKPKPHKPGQPLEEDIPEIEESQRDWYILKVSSNREESVRAALDRQIKIHGLQDFFGDIIVPVETVTEFTKSGKKRKVKRKLYPGYIVVNMEINDDTWFLVRETSGIGDFTGAGGKPVPMLAHEVDRILGTQATEDGEKERAPIKFNFLVGDRVKITDGNSTFNNFEGEVDQIDETSGSVTVMLTIFNRPTPVKLEHWQLDTI